MFIWAHLDALLFLPQSTNILFRWSAVIKLPEICAYACVRVCVYVNVCLVTDWWPNLGVPYLPPALPLEGVSRYEKLIDRYIALFMSSPQCTLHVHRHQSQTMVVGDFKKPILNFAALNTLNSFTHYRHLVMLPNSAQFKSEDKLNGSLNSFSRNRTLKWTSTVCD